MLTTLERLVFQTPAASLLRLPIAIADPLTLVEAARGIRTLEGLLTLTPLAVAAPLVRLALGEFGLLSFLAALFHEFFSPLHTRRFGLCWGSRWGAA